MYIFGLAAEINENDAQLQYNLGLCCFKDEYYYRAVDHFKKCISIDKSHPFAYNNIAYVYNMQGYYSRTILICKQAKEYKNSDHNTHRHWSFAEFKEGNIYTAIKKIRKRVIKEPNLAENWIVWGLILRTEGNYKSAQHKYMKALRLDSKNLTAIYEMELIT